MRVLTIALAIMISGCAATIEDNRIDNRTVTTSTCTFNGEPCPSATPTGPNETVEIREQGNALEGYDQEFKWSVHPGATRAEIHVVVSGPAGSGVLVGQYSHALSGPGVHHAGRCDSLDGGTSTQISSNPTTLVDDDALRTGDWRLRVCLEPSSMAYDIRVDVHYD